MHIDSICPQCNNINHVDSNGEFDILVHCDGCNKYYDHFCIGYSRTIPFDNRDEELTELKDMIVDTKFARMSDRTTICLLIFENGYEIEGRSTVKDKDDFRIVVGQDVAYEDALKRAMLAFGAIL